MPVDATAMAVGRQARRIRSEAEWEEFLWDPQSQTLSS